MDCEIITVGSEILIGDIVNTNSKFISEQLTCVGFNVLWHTSVGDNEARLDSAIKLALSRSNLVILTGGLGPTHDDITREVVAKNLNEELIESEMLKKSIILKLKSKLGNKITSNNFKQAKIFKNSTIFQNENGTAPGLAVEKNKKLVILLPGPPNELKPMFINYVAPYLKKFSKNFIISKNVYLHGIAESQVDEKIASLLKQTNPSVGIYAKKNEVRLRITCKQKTREECFKEIEIVLNKIKAKLGCFICGIDVPNLETALVQNLINQKKTIAIAESCTGGFIASKVVSVPNASRCFKFSAVCYSDEMKHKILNVNINDLKKHGAVSRIVACQMAENVKLIANSDIGISTTGFAGPAKLNNLNESVGLVYFGISTVESTNVFRVNFQNQNKLSRQEIIQLATSYALNLVLKKILEN